MRVARDFLKTISTMVSGLLEPGKRVPVPHLFKLVAPPPPPTSVAVATAQSVRYSREGTGRMSAIVCLSWRTG